MRDVGCISITTNQADVGERIFSRLDHWLKQNNWRKNVDIDCRIANVSAVEISFVPGEFQSNGTKTLSFQIEPDFPLIEKELERWLIQIV